MVLSIFKVLWNNLKQGPSTDPFPFGETFTPARLRGKVTVDPESCVGCGVCATVCAGNAIKHVEREDGSGKDFYVWHNTCTFCGLCQHYCPTDAIRLTNNWSTAHRNEDKYKMKEHEFIPYARCSECNQPMPHMPHAMLGHIYGNPTEELETIYSLCPECRRQKAAQQFGAQIHG